MIPEFTLFDALLYIGLGAYLPFFLIKGRKYDNQDTVRKIPKPTWPRTKLEEIFGV